ncbi:hypothetical protein HPP92_021965 [Vanilla planifolia]|uniref:Pre-rRNA-processing protein TSR2 homolog n=1 Tax=Vanilla planifolia TaxID=51239 RepID=A0A835PWJ0_VANPL|nr:hypothetical protein HPP92_021965 [Vanilla planifolia]
MLLLEEGVSIVFSQWTALQMAIAEEGYSCSCDRKYQDLISSILSWFNQSKESLYIDDLENLLDDSLVHSFGVVTEDGSIEEVAEQLMIFHEDLLQGNHASIEKLRKAGSTTDVLSRSKQITLDNSN